MDQNIEQISFQKTTRFTFLQSHFCCRRVKTFPLRNACDDVAFQLSMIIIADNGARQSLASAGAWDGISDRSISQAGSTRKKISAIACLQAAWLPFAWHALPKNRRSPLAPTPLSLCSRRMA